MFHPVHTLKYAQYSNYKKKSTHGCFLLLAHVSFQHILYPDLTTKPRNHLVLVKWFNYKTYSTFDFKLMGATKSYSS